ncbi:LacI family DNA-binding transcriptional regulator [Nakamurella alba]|uniref:LacI family DNA-binding transcriptional regulator n=1 Tax=Nakamurella alba TaxID=2665158 RepID=UPI002AC353CC|nr:LacI family DNA-binding transcriptional regulator [Nakamurella alba]
MTGPRDRGGPPKAPTMRDVAEAAGVSKALVSMVIRGAAGVSEDSRRRVLAAAEGIGYRANRTASLLARRRTNLLGVTMQVRNAFHAQLVEEIQAAADAAGYQIVLSAVSRTHDEQRALDTLLEFRCEALLLIGAELAEPDLALISAQAPVVVIGRRTDLTGLDVVRAAEDTAMGLAVDHLVGLGHRRILHVTGGTGAVAADRRRGYETAMTWHGLAGEIRLVEGGHTEIDGAAAGELIARHHGRAQAPTAVAAFNDASAIGVMDSLRAAGLAVPQDISVVGVDDAPLAALSGIRLTSVGQSPAEQASWAVRAAVERLDDGRTERREAVLEPRLVVRSSTAPVPA